MNYVLIGAAMVAAQFTAAATANPDVKRRDVVVERADLDLGTPRGRAVFERRLDAAVVKACGTAHHMEPQQINDMERCRAAARAGAMTVRDAILSAQGPSHWPAVRTSK